MTSLVLNLTDHQQRMLTMSMPEALDYAAKQWPDTPAIVFIERDDPTVSWADLRERVASLRAGLAQAGVKAGEKIGVLLRNQLEFPLTWLAVGSLGAAIVPLNPGYTYREIDFVLTDAGASWLVGASDLLDELAVEDAVGPVPMSRVISAGERAGALSFEALAATPAAGAEADYPEPDELVNIQFTSGTTGLPKGCLLTHRYWMELGVYGAALFEGAGRTLADHPFFYMQNQAYLASAMTGGGTIYVTAGLSRRKFMNWLIDYKIDVAWIDEGILEFPPSEADTQLSLKKVPVAGLPRNLHAALEERFKLTARDFYASTEVGNGTAVPWDRTDLVGSGSMGFCFPHRESKVIDAELNEVAPGQPGELCFRGSGMMLGYHNRPEANAELFLPGGWFRTGDLVRKEADGQHFYLGRLRDIIRRSGESIAAVEVEAQIYAMPEVDDVAVIPVPDPDRDEEVKAIVVLQPGATVTPQQIVDRARQGLADFKLPRYVEFRDELPYTASGKVAKGQLKQEEPLHEGVTDVLGPGPRRS